MGGCSTRNGSKRSSPMGTPVFSTTVHIKRGVHEALARRHVPQHSTAAVENAKSHDGIKKARAKRPIANIRNSLARSKPEAKRDEQQRSDYRQLIAGFPTPNDALHDLQVPTAPHGVDFAKRRAARRLDLIMRRDIGRGVFFRPRPNAVSYAGVNGGRLDLDLSTELRDVSRRIPVVSA